MDLSLYPITLTEDEQVNEVLFVLVLVQVHVYILADNCDMKISHNY